MIRSRTYWAIAVILALQPGLSRSALAQSTEAVISVSRTQGVAPLYVFFDGFTLSSDAGRPAIEDRFHQLTYEWNFGDLGSGTWPTDGLSKNTQIGPVVAHVFDQPGEYTVTLVARSTDASGTLQPNTPAAVRITVDDPDLVFASTTRCVSDTTDFAGCPVCSTQNGNTCVISGDFDAALSAGLSAGNRRVLFRRDGRFTSDRKVDVDFDGPGLIGAFGSGAKPEITSTHNGGVLKFGRIVAGSSLAHDDWRVVDLNLNGPGSPNFLAAVYQEISNAGPIRQILFYRLDWRGYHWGIFNNGQRSNASNDPRVNEEVAIVECTSQDMSNKAVFLKVARGALMGNDFNGWPTRQATGMTHTYRMAYADRLAILHNKVISGGLDAGTIRACPWNGGVQSGVCNGRYTQYVYSANNEHIGCDGTAGAAPCMRVADVKPGITPNEGRIRDLIFDSNVFRAGPDGPMGSTLTGFVFHGDRITVRNNICDATNGRANVLCFHVSLDSVGTPAPVGSRVYNNTCYRGPDGAGVACVGATAGSGHEARNNLVFNSGTGTSNMIFRSVGLTQSNNVIASSNPFVSSAPTTPADFMLRSDAPAIDVGVHISSNLVDFSGSPRPRDGNGDGISNPDVGALEFLGIDSPGAPSPPILLDGGP